MVFIPLFVVVRFAQQNASYFQFFLSSVPFEDCPDFFNIRLSCYVSFLLQEDDQSFDKYDHEMLLHGLGLHDSPLCFSIVNFHFDLKETLRGEYMSH